jgi:hypothetical protein
MHIGGALSVIAGLRRVNDFCKRLQTAATRRNGAARRTRARPRSPGNARPQLFGCGSSAGPRMPRLGTVSEMR